MKTPLKILVIGSSIVGLASIFYFFSRVPKLKFTYIDWNNKKGNKQDLTNKPNCCG
jgi:hypothetical protein